MMNDDLRGQMDPSKWNTKPRRAVRANEMQGVTWAQGPADDIQDGKIAEQARVEEAQRTLDQLLRELAQNTK